MNPFLRSAGSAATDEALRRWSGAVLSGAPAARGAPPAAPPEIREFARSQGIGPSLGARPGNALWQQLLLEETDARNAIAVEMARREEFLSTLEVLKVECSLRPVVFKGQALAHVLYERPWLRPRGDIDLLVERRHCAVLQAVLERQGYVKQLAIEGDVIVKQFSMQKTRAGVIHVWDVHWEISNRPEMSGLLSYERLRYEALEVPLADTAFLAPSMVDNLLIACLHLIGHHAGDVRMIWLYDIHLLVQSMSAADRDAFLTRATDNSTVRSACHEALALAAAYLPAEATRRLAGELDPGPGVARSGYRFYAGRLLQDARALDAGSRLRFLRQHAFPSADYMMKRFGLRHRWQVPVWYVVRIGRAIPKLFRRR